MSGQERPAGDPTILIRVRMTTKAYAMLERRARKLDRSPEAEAGFLLQEAMVSLIRRAEVIRGLQARLVSKDSAEMSS